jgi:hypothetical protein
LQKNVGIAVRPSYDQDDSAKCYQSSFIFNARKQLQWQLQQLQAMQIKI